MKKNFFFYKRGIKIEKKTNLIFSTERDENFKSFKIFYQVSPSTTTTSNRGTLLFLSLVRFFDSFPSPLLVFYVSLLLLFSPRLCVGVVLSPDLLGLSGVMQPKDL